MKEKGVFPLEAGMLLFWCFLLTDGIRYFPAFQIKQAYTWTGAQPLHAELPIALRKGIFDSF